MPDATLDVLVQPFKENDPGPHVTAVVTALEGHGLAADMGPFATTTAGDASVIAAALPDVVASAIRQGATSVQLVVEVAAADADG